MILNPALSHLRNPQEPQGIPLKRSRTSEI